jgi:NTP pyrophosphatase (non-canonical NTP hydrolase)
MDADFRFDDYATRLVEADKVYGTYKSSHEALGVITEEYHELIEAIRTNNIRHIFKEATDLALCAMKLARDTDDFDFKRRSGK